MSERNQTAIVARVTKTTKVTFHCLFLHVENWLMALNDSQNVLKSVATHKLDLKALFKKRYRNTC